MAASTALYRPVHRCRCFSGKAALSIRWPQGVIAVMKGKTNRPLRKARLSMACLTASRRIPARWGHHCIMRCCWGSVPIWGISALPLLISQPRVPPLMTGVTMPAVYPGGRSIQKIFPIRIPPSRLPAIATPHRDFIPFRKLSISVTARSMTAYIPTAELITAVAACSSTFPSGFLTGARPISTAISRTTGIWTAMSEASARGLAPAGATSPGR